MQEVADASTKVVAQPVHTLELEHVEQYVIELEQEVHVPPD